MRDLIEYQFPMGKVKGNLSGRNRRPSRVSIPYGKGKDEQMVKTFASLSYQFPMGKVKLGQR